MSVSQLLNDVDDLHDSRLFPGLTVDENVGDPAAEDLRNGKLTAEEREDKSVGRRKIERNGNAADLRRLIVSILDQKDVLKSWLKGEKKQGTRTVKVSSVRKEWFSVECSQSSLFPELGSSRRQLDGSPPS